METKGRHDLAFIWLEQVEHNKGFQISDILRLISEVWSSVPHYLRFLTVVKYNERDRAVRVVIRERR